MKKCPYKIILMKIQNPVTTVVKLSQSRRKRSYWAHYFKKCLRVIRQSADLQKLHVTFCQVFILNEVFIKNKISEVKKIQYFNLSYKHINKIKFGIFTLCYFIYNLKLK